MAILKYLIQQTYEKIVVFSPHIELFFRRVYWNNISKLKKLKKIEGVVRNGLTDFSKVTEFLKTLLENDDEIMIVHSSFSSLSGVKKTPKKIIADLLDVVGEEGTLAMNAGRSFPEDPGLESYLENDEDISKIINYDVMKSKVWTGALPLFMIRDPRASISEFPINSMVAIGKKAALMMENNIEGLNSSSCGDNSSWKYCTENNALIVGLGLDLTHSLTIMHVAEENKKDWPIKNWYRRRKFNVITEDGVRLIEVNERKPKWGALHFAEKTLKKDLLKASILHVTEIDRVRVEYLRAKDLYDFLNKRNQNGYPYFNWKKG